MHFNRHLVSDRPMHGAALLQMNRRSRGQAQAIKDFAAEEFAFFDRCQYSTGFGIYRFMADHHCDGSGTDVSRTWKIAEFRLHLRTYDNPWNKIGMSDEGGNKAVVGE